MHSSKEGLYPAGYDCKPGPMHPQAEYNAGPIVRESVPPGVREPVIYPVQVGGQTARRESGNQDWSTERL